MAARGLAGPCDGVATRTIPLDSGDGGHDVCGVGPGDGCMRGMETEVERETEGGSAVAAAAAAASSPPTR